MNQKEAEQTVLLPSATIVPMSLQPVIPSWVALQQSPRPLRRPQQASRTILLLYTAQQRNEICPRFPCLNRRVHSTTPIHLKKIKGQHADLSNSGGIGIVPLISPEHISTRVQKPPS
jgi:hypothetical protein